MNLKTTKNQLIKRLESEKELKSFVDKIENVLTWVSDNPENSDNMIYILL